MARPVPLRAEVTRRAYQPLAEVMLPDAIHHHTRSQWIGRVRDRLSQFHAPCPVVEPPRIARGQNRYEMGRRRSAGVVPVTPNPDPLFRRILFVFDHLEV